jgi:hypothetical protein
VQFATAAAVRQQEEQRRGSILDQLPTKRNKAKQRARATSAGSAQSYGDTSTIYTSNRSTEQYYQNQQQQQSPHSPRPPETLVDVVDHSDINYFGSIPEPESKILDEWKIGQRNPLQRTSLLDTMTTTVIAPFDKMKTQVSDHLNSLRERRSSKELQPLAFTDYFAESSIFMLPSYQCASNMIGRCSNPLILTGDAMNEDQELNEASVK